MREHQRNRLVSSGGALEADDLQKVIHFYVLDFGDLTPVSADARVIRSGTFEQWAPPKARWAMVGSRRGSLRLASVVWDGSNAPTSQSLGALGLDPVASPDLVCVHKLPSLKLVDARPFAQSKTDNGGGKLTKP